MKLVLSGGVDVIWSTTVRVTLRLLSLTCSFKKGGIQMKISEIVTLVSAVVAALASSIIGILKVFGL